MSASRMVLGVLGFCVALGLNAGAQGGASTPQSRANELQSRYMTAVRAQLTSKLDTKTAVAGMVLTARTTAAVTLADGTEIPEGTKLMGRVLAVRAKTDENAESAVTVTFDQAQMKDGKMIPVRTLIRGMSGSAAPAVREDSTAAGPGRNSQPIPATGTDSMGGLDAGPAMGGARGSGGGGMGGGGMGGGGTAGGTTRGGRGAPTQATGGIPEVATTSPVSSTAEGGETVRVAPKPTGVPGVLLYASPTSDVSGTLIGREINVRLDNGVQLTLGMISRQAPTGDSGGVK
jgi:hypothetical protein